ncbi:hypothetical protein [Metabacillus endolithicus]|uniref:Uncharacterized protein n=1 Tax=Metabacillus endolithicus TaxID=1535204 RepID=A0ABW5BSI7_9BACI|nr:hypothetical protein [Metabacillus endolithicus]UPG63100.1 hypothetical protein MVE64_22585 [Metabacillus endolithicus]
MKLHTLIEYCLLIFFSGIYFAFLGFESSGVTFIIGVIFIYIIISLSLKRILPHYHLADKKMSILVSVLLVIGSVFITMLILTILAT